MRAAGNFVTSVATNQRPHFHRLPIALAGRYVIDIAPGKVAVAGRQSVVMGKLLDETGTHLGPDRICLYMKDLPWIVEGLRRHKQSIGSKLDFSFIVPGTSPSFKIYLTGQTWTPEEGLPCYKVHIRTYFTGGRSAPSPTGVGITFSSTEELLNLVDNLQELVLHGMFLSTEENRNLLEVTRKVFSEVNSKVTFLLPAALLPVFSGSQVENKESQDSGVIRAAVDAARSENHLKTPTRYAIPVRVLVAARFLSDDLATMLDRECVDI